MLPNPILLAAGRVIAEMRDSMVIPVGRLVGRPAAPPPRYRAPLSSGSSGSCSTCMTEMVGPLRREANTVWFHACEHYGRIASARGLAAGEVVEELHIFASCSSETWRRCWLPCAPGRVWPSCSG